jgi:hypothetical protein
VSKLTARSIEDILMQCNATSLAYSTEEGNLFLLVGSFVLISTIGFRSPKKARARVNMQLYIPFP